MMADGNKIGSRPYNHKSRHFDIGYTVFTALFALGLFFVLIPNKSKD
jgi:hypothetical protein